MICHKEKRITLKRIIVALNTDSDIPCISSLPFLFSRKLRMIGQYDTTLCFVTAIGDVPKDCFASIFKVKDVAMFFSTRSTCAQCSSS